MKITMKKSFAVIMALVMCVSVLFGMNLSAFAADNTVNYVYNGTYIYNWGERGTTATFLSPKAEAFYTNNKVTLSGLLGLDGSSTTDSVPSSKLYNSLYELMATTSYTSYEATKDLFKYTDCQNSGNPSKISSFYSGAEIGPDWDNGSTWNREHVWPNSKSNGGSDSNTRRETDIMMLRPTATNENGSRSNTAYGESSSYYNPNSESGGDFDLRGDVARVVLYVYVRWGGDATYHDGAIDYMWGENGVIESKDVLLKWMEEDPVDTWELGRNDSVEAITGTRNVFVDYPELAFDLFNEAVPTGYTSPSGGEDIEGSTDGDSTGNYTLSTTTTEVVFNLGVNGTATHSDGKNNTVYTETVNGYTLSITDGVKFYTDARDAKGNSAFKLGTSSEVGSFSMTVPDNVTSVIFKVAKYKTYDTTVNINGTPYTITGSSDSGVYDSIVVDTIATKTITFTTVTKRCMIDSITYVITGSSGGDTPDTPVYTYTAVSNNESYGKVTQDGNTITATAEDSYRISDVVVSPEGTATVTNNSNGTFTVSNLTADAQITINFEQIPIYTVTFNENSVDTSALTKYEGEEITLPECDSTKIPDGYEFLGWATVKNATTDIKSVGSTYTVSSNVIFYAQYKEQSDLPITTATITFDNTSKRIVGTTSQQKWVENGITVTNDKAKSTTDINTSYYNPIRVYANSSLTIEYPSMTKIEITANTASYATAFASNTIENATVVVADKVVTITFVSPVNSFVVEKIASQTRLDSITIYAEQSSSTNEYTVTYIENGEETGSATLAEGTVITLPSDTATPSDKVFVGWATVETATSDILEAGSSYTVTGDVTFYAQYTDKVVETATHNFVKVTEDLTDWTGTYLIVYEAGNVAFNGSLTNLKTANGFDVSIADSKIKATDSALAASFTIEAIEGGYTIKSASGYYIGRTSANTDSNDLLFNQSTQYVNSISLSDGDVNVVSGNTYLRWNASSSFFRYYKSDTYTNQQPIALYKLDVADVSGAQVTVGADLSIDYYVDITNIENVSDGDLSIRFTVDGDETSTTVALDKSKTAVIDGVTYYVFTFAGLAPQRMTDNIKAELLLGDTVVDILAQYSVQQNAINLLADNPSTKLIQFITDMLYYGAAAQQYTNYNTDNLATSGVSGLGTQSTAVPEKLLANLSISAGSSSFKSATVWFDAVNALVVKVNNPENATIKVCVKVGDGEEVELQYDSENDRYITEGIKATEFDTIYTFSLYEGETVVQTLEYSVNVYAYSKYTNGKTQAMKDLALALYRFGKSAKAYAAQ